MSEIIDIFAKLGSRLTDFGQTEESQRIIQQAIAENEWFNQDDIVMATQAIREEFLIKEKLQAWAQRYNIANKERNVAIIMAGNIPLVGFFDMLCVLIAGHRAAIKPSSKDKVLTEYIIKLLRDISPTIPIAPYDVRTSYDMVIATGSDQAAQYFRTHYASTPSLVRGSRYSVAVLLGDESPEELQALQRDIFSYNGLGCRNISLIFIPEDSDLVLCPPKMGQMYHGNYLHCKAMREMLGQEYIDFGECIAVQQQEFSPNISQINYYRYSSIHQIEQWLNEHSDKIQCIATRGLQHPRAVAFGRAQYPTLTDYADGVDVLEFLTT